MLGLALLVAAPAAAHAASGVTLRGSHDSMVRQHRIARENDFSFLRTPAQVREWVKAGRLVPIRGNEDYAVAGASFAVTRPQTLTLVERLAAQYHDACGEKLYVTSATRPEDLQPWNASPLSVHPAGMAVDLRVSSSAACRSWIEQVLLSLESKGVLDVTREHHPPHYHVAVFPDAYMAYVERLQADSAKEAQAAAAKALAAQETAAPAPARVEASAAPTPDKRDPQWLSLISILLGVGVAIGYGSFRGRGRCGGGDD